MKDRAMQALYVQALDPMAETTADPHSYGLRKARCCADAMAQCAIALSNSTRPHWILEGAMQSCFDQLSHPWLLDPIPMDTTILSAWLKAGYMDKSVLYATDDGTPQGGICSPVLANMALDGLERILRKKYPHSGRRALKGKTKQVNLIRYADDFLITGIAQEVLEAEVKPLVTEFLHARGLELSAEKTSITPIEDGCDFLGQNVRKYKGHFLTRPSKKNVQAFLPSIRKVVKDNKPATAYWLITPLNPQIRGWANFHRHAAAKETFVHVDTAIFKALWRWARRRHPKQGKRWVADRYFGRSGQRNWHFFGTAKDSDGNTISNWLCHASAIPVTR